MDAALAFLREFRSVKVEKLKDSAKRDSALWDEEVTAKEAELTSLRNSLTAVEGRASSEIALLQSKLESSGEKLMRSVAAKMLGLSLVQAFS